MQKKVREVHKLHELLAKWIESYQKAQMKNTRGSQAKGNSGPGEIMNSSSTDIENLVAE